MLQADRCRDAHLASASSVEGTNSQVRVVNSDEYTLSLMTAEECRELLIADRYALAKELWKHPHDRDHSRIASLRDSIARLCVGLKQLEGERR